MIVQRAVTDLLIELFWITLSWYFGVVTDLLKFTKCMDA